MRVLLFYPNKNCQLGYNHGLGSLAAILRERGHPVRLVNLNEKLGPLPDDGELRRIVADFDPGLIGFSVLTQQVDYASECCQVVHAFRPGVPIVWGGTHPTMTPEAVARLPFVSYVGVGECEHALAELCEALEKGTDTTRIPSIWARTADGRIVPNPVAGSYPDLSAIPMPAYDVFDFQHMVDTMNGWVQIMATRGCPYRCTYCFNHKIVDRYKEEAGVKPKEYLRFYPVDRVMDLMLDLHRRYTGIRTWIFDDDLFTWHKDFVLEFCRKYKETGLEIPWVVNGHVKVFDEEIAQAMADAHCYIAKFGLESGSDRVRNILKRHMTNKDIIRAFDAAAAVGLHTSAFLMFGLPTETEEDIWETIRLTARIKPGRYRWSIFFPFPGTVAYETAVETGFVDWEKYFHLDNYFDGSCMDFNPRMNLWIEKLQRTYHWYVNSLVEDWPAWKTYRKLADEVTALDEEGWEARKDSVLDEDRDLSERLIKQGIPHYSVRYSKVMAVRSDFVVWERDREAREKSGLKAVPLRGGTGLFPW
ncbi:MAG: B12-binding domain-containing radical SAM protein [Planctomycetes bacterium]|nr:B12-binding domain-containing radical SAM protein [Planctomycetota bacterium]